MLGLSSASAFGQDATVAKRLTKFGQLRKGESESLAEDVSKRMRRAADMTSAQDPLRMAVARALGTPNTQDAMVAAKVRLRLYAGLNEWALEKLFVPRAGGLAQCQQDIGVSSRHCEALIAAAGKVSAAEASKLAAGPAPAPKGGAARPLMAARPAAAPAQNQSRFGKRFDSGFRGGATAAPVHTAQRPSSAAARPAPMPMVAAAPTNTRAEYQRRRQEYLDRQKREMEARKAKVVATAVGDMPQRGPASAEEAEVVGMAPSEAAEPSAPAQAKAAPGGKGKTAPAEEAPAEEAPAEEAPKKEALDNSFLEGLLDDPLGGKK